MREKQYDGIGDEWWSSGSGGSRMARLASKTSKNQIKAEKGPFLLSAP